jgi:hypothetical protein
VEYILVKNRDKLMVFLQKFQSDRQGKPSLTCRMVEVNQIDEQFADEKNFLLQKLAGLKANNTSSGNGNGY